MAVKETKRSIMNRLKSSNRLYYEPGLLQSRSGKWKLFVCITLLVITSVLLFVWAVI